MKFIRQHTDCLLRTIDNIVFESMLDYMIERSEILEDEIELLERSRSFKTECLKSSNKKKQELSSLIEIIRAAGVDVIE